MSLAPGMRFGVYEVTAAIGAGGMGEVYRARDTKLHRDVALKILPELFAADPERLARFKREAHVLASLNHTNIAAIYGLEESDGVQALVLELVEGPTLAELIAKQSAAESNQVSQATAPSRRRGATERGGGAFARLRRASPKLTISAGERRRGAPRGLEIEDALPIARQICDALEAAHDHGIIHRDLKPANIKVRDDGTVKVLDFGLAKLVGPAEAGPYDADRSVRLQADGSQSPTMSLAATRAGVILGTAAYMAPEQARGKVADKRADIWAFGCVLYEMLTGKRAFDGEDVAVVLASVIKGEPDWAALPADVPTPIVTLLRSCLEKERRSRIADIGAATFVLTHAAQLVEHVEVPVVALQPAAVPRPPVWRRATPIAAAALFVGALLAGIGGWLLTRPVPLSVIRTTVTTAGSTALTLSAGDRDVAITPDGSRIVYGSSNQLLVRALDQLEPTVLSGGLGLPGPRGVFISPDGQWVGFFERNTTMKKVAITGGPPVTVRGMDGASRGATWSEDGTIIFATLSPATGLQRVSAAGGESTVLTKPDRERGEGDHLWPEFLPGGKAVLFTIIPANGGIDNAQIAVLDLRTGTSKVLIRGGSHAHYVPTGHLVYGVTGTLRAVAFDLRRLEVVGTPALVLEGVVTTDQGAADVAVAANGSLVYVPGGAGDRQTIVSVDRQGRASPLPGLPPDTYRDVRVSPDGARLAVATDTAVWTYDVVRATLSRLTTRPAFDRLTPGAVPSPLWRPDGQRIIFTSIRAGYPELYWRQADGTGSDERLLTRAKDLVDLRAMGWSVDGKQLLFTEVPPSRQRAIWQMAIERPSDARLLVNSGNYPAVSPNGRWIAYESNVSGRTEIYVERYPELGNRQQISTGGGRIPLWSRDGRELFFSGISQQMFAVAVQPGTRLVAGRPQVLFEFAMFLIAGTRAYDIAPDGRFVIIQSGQADAGGGTAQNLVVVQNWFEELKRLVPVN